MDAKQYPEAEAHARRALEQASVSSSSDSASMQLLHGMSLFELQRWGEAVLALRRAAEMAGSRSTVGERARRYLGVAAAVASAVNILTCSPAPIISRHLCVIGCAVD